MRGVFDERETPPAVAQPDTELTLSSTVLLLAFLGLLLICGVFFGLGYSVGHRSAPDPVIATAAAADAPAVAHTESGHAKPSANAQPPAPAAPPSGNRTLAPTADRIPKSQQWTAVKPAMAAEGEPVQPQAPQRSAVAPAMMASGADSGGSFMVQIAAVAQPEDADVLMSALRKRSYAVMARRDPIDGLIHVRIGPFRARVEADAWRQKLLNDGYNAIVQP